MLKKTKQNKGRSMIEMLSVLAVIGMLSIAALLGYKSAIASHKANIILNDARMIAGVVLQKETLEKENEIINTDEYKPETSYTIYAIKQSYNEKLSNELFAIEIDDVDERVCKSVLNKVGKSYKDVKVNNLNFEEENTDICNDEDDKNIIELIFGSNPDCPIPCGNECCFSGEVCDIETKECVKDTKNCKSEFEYLCGEGCCSRLNRCCSGNCCDDNTPCCGGQCCPSGICAGDEETGTCCGQDKNGVQLIVKNGTCACPDNKRLINNTCMAFGCFGGTAGKNDWNCCLGENVSSSCLATSDSACGQACNEAGTSCSFGFCTDLCPEGTRWASLNKVSIYGHRVLWGCINDKTNTACYQYYGSGQCVDLNKKRNGVYYRCGLWCSLDGKCRDGDCENNCTRLSQTLGKDLIWQNTSGGSDEGYYGCYNSENELACTRYSSDSKYSCYKENKICGSGCYADGTNCTGQNLCTEEGNTCPEGTTWRIQETGRYKGYPVCAYPDNSFCIVQENRCITSIDDNFCGGNCLKNGKIDINSCLNGLCDPSVCTDLGLKFERIGSWFGCRNPENGMICYNYYNGKINCYDKNNAACGQNCGSYLGEKCEASCTNFTCPEGWTATSNGGLSVCKKDDVTCGYYEGSGIYCKKGNSGYCGTYCSLDGVCTYGYCFDECSKGTYYKKMTALTSWYSLDGCYSDKNGTQCTKSGNGNVCYDESNTNCGSGCDIDGENCKTGLCACGDGKILVNGKCQSVDVSLDCENGVCKIGSRNCGYDCKIDGSDCSEGNCLAEDCKEGTTFGRVTNQFYGCINSEYVGCYKSGFSWTCYKNGSKCGDGCDADGTNCTSEGQTCSEE